MRTGLYKRLSNEELVELYKAGESDAFEALLKNTEGLRATLAQRSVYLRSMYSLW